jgi:phosphate transport system substrate-binding protein
MLAGGAGVGSAAGFPFFSGVVLLRRVAGMCALLLWIGCGAVAAAQQMTLTGAGSTFAYPLYSKWAAEYLKTHPRIQVNYQSIGSGGGIRQVSIGTVDFGGTDGPMTDSQLAEARNKLNGASILHFPTALGAAVPVYNLPGVSAELNFTPAALAGIFLGTIQKWNDPAIAQANPAVKLPNEFILVIHRADGSGTSFLWVDYLAKVNPAFAAKVRVSTSPHWPVGLGGKGNEGVAGLVRQMPNSIGYVELVYALNSHMLYGKIQNREGQFVKADLNSVSAAATAMSKLMPADFRADITNPPGVGSYPVCSFTWMLLPTKMADRAKGAALKEFLTWGLTEGQRYGAALSYAPLSKDIVDRELQALKLLQY